MINIIFESIGRIMLSYLVPKFFSVVIHIIKLKQFNLDTENGKVQKEEWLKNYIILKFKTGKKQPNV